LIISNFTLSCYYFSSIRLHPIATLFPYTTLFRSPDTVPRRHAPLAPQSRAGSLPRRSLPGPVWRGRGSASVPGSRRKGSCPALGDRKSTRLNSSHVAISYAVFCLKKKKRARQHRG